MQLLDFCYTVDPPLRTKLEIYDAKVLETILGNINASTIESMLWWCIESIRCLFHAIVVYR